MSNHLHRRAFIASAAGLPLISSVVNPASVFSSKKASAASKGLKTSLNAFSFNDPLLKGNMTIDEMIDFCASTGFEGVDITGYYFKGYPQVPPDDYLFGIKRKAFGLGIEISGTGVRNDFTNPEKSKRASDVELVKSWTEVAAKIGAPVIRVFAGNQKNDGVPKEQITDWMIKDLQTCVDFGKQHGVIIGLQNHNDFIQTADQVNNIIEAINSPWLGLIVDTGSYRVLDPYEEIQRCIKHVVNWQVKEKVLQNGVEKDIDIDKLISIIKSSNYKGYLPIETLGEGDAKAKVSAMYQKLSNAIG